MQSFDWLSTIKINIKMLRFVALWPDEGRYGCNLYTFYAALSIIVFIHFHNFFIIMGIVLASENLEDLTARIFMSSSEILTSIKAYFLIKNVTRLNKLTKSLDSEKFCPPRTVEQVRLIQPQIKDWKIAYFGFWVSCWSTVIFMLLAPVLNGSVKTYQLPIHAWFPYNTKTSPNYEITYVYQSFGISVIVAAVINIDLFVMNMMMIVSVQCEILCDNLRNLTHSDRDGFAFGQKLVECIQHHKEIVRL
jgi:hypothetical protein